MQFSGMSNIESYQVYRRPESMRGYGYGKNESVFSRSTRNGSNGDGLPKPRHADAFIAFCTGSPSSVRLQIAVTSKQSVSPFLNMGLGERPAHFIGLGIRYQGVSKGKQLSGILSEQARSAIAGASYDLRCLLHL